MRELRRCLSDHKRIMVNLVTMVDQSSPTHIYHIVYELAAYDLNGFLTDMPYDLRAKRHATAKPGRTGSIYMWPGDLISESVNLADALDYLHNRLYSKSHVSLSHNDSKPENILVIDPEITNEQDWYPVGQWKLADFGLSVVKNKRSSDSSNKNLSADNALFSPSNPQQTYRTERPSSVSKAMPARYPGQYTAPELDQKTPQKADGRSADVWSFGCVLSEISTYAVKLDCKPVEKFRKSLEQSDPSDPKFYRHVSKDIKREFLDHLDTLPAMAREDTRTPNNTHWTASYVELIKEIVVKEPKDRLGAKGIRPRLSKIELSMRPEKHIWLNHSLPPLVVETDAVHAESALSCPTSAISQSPTDIHDSDHSKDESIWRVPSISIDPPEHTNSEVSRPAHLGDNERRRATAPR